jgi:hypothetical protein
MIALSTDIKALLSLKNDSAFHLVPAAAVHAARYNQPAERPTSKISRAANTTHWFKKSRPNI